MENFERSRKQEQIPKEKTLGHLVREIRLKALTENIGKEDPEERAK